MTHSSVCVAQETRVCVHNMKIVQQRINYNFTAAFELLSKQSQIFCAGARIPEKTTVYIADLKHVHQPFLPWKIRSFSFYLFI